MNDDSAKPPEKQSHRPRRAPVEPLPGGASMIWITLAIILALEVAGVVWFYRSCTRPSTPKTEQPAPRPAPPPPS